MARIYRLVVAFMASILFVGSCFAFPPTPSYSVQGFSGSSREAACQAAAAGAAPTPGYASYRYYGISASNFCQVMGLDKDGKDSSLMNWSIQTKPPSCPENATLGGGDCACNAGHDEYGKQCVPSCKADEVRQADGTCKKRNTCPEGSHEEGGMCAPDKCPDGQILSAGICVPDPDLCPDGSKKVNGECPNKCEKGETKNLTVGGNMPTAFCHNGCTFSSGPPPFPMVCVGDTASGSGYCVMTYVGTGSSCNGGGSWPSGSGGGTGGGSGGEGGGTGGGTGGGAGGGGGGGSGPGGNTGTGSGGSGGGTGGGTGSGSGGDSGDGSGSGGEGSGSSGMIPGKDPTDGKCPSGMYMSKGKCYPNDNEEEDPDGTGKCPVGYRKVGDKCQANKPIPDSEEGKDFCKQNPTLEICKTGAFGGSCSANFKCDGDAVQCAMAREQHIRNCQIFEMKTDESNLYFKEKGKEGDQTKDLPGNDVLDISGRIDTGDALGGGACIGDLNIPVMGTMVSLPISLICPYLAMLGNVLVAVSMLLAMRIVMRG